MTTTPTAAPTPSAMLPAETSTALARRPGEVLDEVLAGRHTAIVRNERRQIVLVDTRWYDRQPGSSPNMISARTADGAPISRAAYVEAVQNRANTNRTDPIQLDAVEAEFVGEMLDELAAVYGESDPLGRLAHDCARMINLRLGR